MISFTRGARESFNSFESFEGNLRGESTIQFLRSSKKIDITNDSPSVDLLYKFSSLEDFGTLKPTETVSLPFQTTQVFLSGAGADFRVWSFR